MSAHVTSPEITFHAEHTGTTRRIWRVFWLLSLLTVCELGFGLLIYNIHKGDIPNPGLVLAFKGAVCILTVAKAYFIVSVFMPVSYTHLTLPTKRIV